jgi:kinesin family member 5
VKGRQDLDMGYHGENGHHTSSHSLRPPVVRKSKLVVVDLAGSERIDKSGMWNYSILSVLLFKGLVAIQIFKVLT